ncbi:putative disease resistance protein [Vitis vinifera]|uniref:Putative disease resistance protein n=1 Tax=Vitis vinifera TaxID=29760 RepID=A0A438HW36_VITVI|nr:putative disease resistance protein [Vitis vinifera]
MWGLPLAIKNVADVLSKKDTTIEAEGLVHPMEEKEAPEAVAERGVGVTKTLEVPWLETDKAGYASFISGMPQSSSNSLKTLQTLWGLLVKEETPVKDGLDRLKSYDEKNQPWDLHLKPLSSHANLSNVYLLGQLKNPSIVSEFPHSLTDLTLSWSGLAEDPMQTLDKLPKLRVLRLLRRAYVGKNMLCSSGGFPELRVLKLWMLEQLEEWNVEKGALQGLRDLEVRSCIKLGVLPEELQHRSFLKLEFI